MTQSTSLERNPFALLVDPQAVLAAVEKSERLGRLNRHLCRPLDRPLPGVAAPEGAGDGESGDVVVDSEFPAQ
jgi:hypothetical protein